MNTRKRRALVLTFACSLFASLSSAQSNTVPGIDVFLNQINNVQALGREGAFPDGVNGVSFATTICNIGTELVPWRGPMNADHPFISFLVARESNGRFEQVSDWSYVKHGFFATTGNACSTCLPPPGPQGRFLGLGCSDTYKTTTNGENFYLGPPDEIDPWLGGWDPVCSHFDRGEPAVAPPFDCDGNRSLTNTQAQALGPVGHRIRIQDADLNVPGASFAYQAFYVVGGEAEALRSDNIAWRPLDASWTGSQWNLASTADLEHGSILEAWDGASVSSNTNGADDGRVYVGVKVTGPNQGLYHYEYAVLNRDNSRGIGAFRIPVCDGARVVGAGFRDIDDDASNDWSFSVASGEVVFETGAAPLKWNTIYNFWFDSDAAPLADTSTVDAFAAGPGAGSFAVSTTAPGALFNVFLGSGCSTTTAPTLYAKGTPARASLGNASFELVSEGNLPGEVHFLRYGIGSGTTNLQGCTVYLAGTLGLPVAGTLSDAFGVAVHPTPIPNDPSLEGLEVDLQAIGRRPAAGTLFGNFELSDGLRVRVGDLLSDCP